MSGFTVVDCSTVVATHLSHLMQVHAAKLLGRVETQSLVEHLTKQAPQLIEDVIPKMVGISSLQRILQLLLEVLPPDSQAVAVLVQDVGITPERALAMAGRIPAQLIGADGRLGQIAPGRAADLVLLDAKFRLIQSLMA